MRKNPIVNPLTIPNTCCHYCGARGFNIGRSRRTNQEGRIIDLTFFICTNCTYEYKTTPMRNTDKQETKRTNPRWIVPTRLIS